MFRVLTKNGFLKKVQRGPYGSAGSRIPESEGRSKPHPLNPPPKSAPAYSYTLWVTGFYAHTNELKLDNYA